MKWKGLEFMVGVFIIMGLIALSVLAFKVSGLTMGNGESYRVFAEFNHIGDLKVRAPVTIAGVAVGRVTKIQLDPETFQAFVTLAIDKRNDNIPTDSTANIFTAGLIGSNYISIVPGFDETFLKNGDKIENTNQALILQNLIGQFMFSLKNDKDKDKEVSD